MFTQVHFCLSKPKLPSDLTHSYNRRPLMTRNYTFHPSYIIVACYGTPAGLGAGVSNKYSNFTAASAFSISGQVTSVFFSFTLSFTVHPL